MWVPSKYQSAQSQLDDSAGALAFKGSNFFSTFYAPDLLSPALPGTTFTGTGAATHGVDTDGRPALVLSSGATASSYARLHATLLGAALPQMTLGQTDKFFLSFRMRLTTAIDSVTQVGRANYPTVSNVLIGALGSVSTTKFVGFVGASGLTSTINIDTAWHTLQFWRDGTTSFFAVDGEAPISGVNNYYAPTISDMLVAYNNGTAANRGANFRNIYTALAA